jgi:hypothetical protein
MKYNHTFTALIVKGIGHQGGAADEGGSAHPSNARIPKYRKLGYKGGGQHPLGLKTLSI